MNDDLKKDYDVEKYQGFEQGPIRPPSEAYSLLVRVTRNCPYNRCTFCPVYKGTKFSRRPVEHVIRDIDSVYKYVEIFRNTPRQEFNSIGWNIPPDEEIPFVAAANWFYAGGMKSIFLQDANSLIIKPSEIIKILTHLKERFPEVERITSYARSHTLARISDADLKAIRNAGLNRIHVGMESGSDKILKMVKKGSTKEDHIKAGQKVKRAGMELSEYYMPGLGGKHDWREHATETADAMNQINPDFIRLRTLAIPLGSPLCDDYEAGRFVKNSEIEIVEEIKIFIEKLEGIDSVVMSDHILNLFADLEGKLPDDKEKMVAILDNFLALVPENQRLYLAGRRLGIFHVLSDLDDPRRRSKAQRTCNEYGVTEDNIEEFTENLLRRFI